MHGRKRRRKNSRNLICRMTHMSGDRGRGVRGSRPHLPRCLSRICGASAPLHHWSTPNTHTSDRERQGRETNIILMRVLRVRNRVTIDWRPHQQMSVNWKRWHLDTACVPTMNDFGAFLSITACNKRENGNPREKSRIHQMYRGNLFDCTWRVGYSAMFLILYQNMDI